MKVPYLNSNLLSGCFPNLIEVQIPKTIIRSPENPRTKVFFNELPVSSSISPKTIGNPIQVRFIAASVLFFIRFNLDERNLVYPNPHLH